MPTKHTEHYKKIRGNPSKRYITGETILPYKPPKIPDNLSKKAKKHWKVLSKPLIIMKKLADFHLPIFNQLCEILATLDYLNDCLKDGKDMFVNYQQWDNKKGTENPMLEESEVSKTRRQYMGIALKYASKFKLTTEDMKGVYRFEDEAEEDEELID